MVAHLVDLFFIGEPEPARNQRLERPFSSPESKLGHISVRHYGQLCTNRDSSAMQVIFLLPKIL
jgi:hypothetical protein